MNNDLDQAMADFLAKGGVIQQAAYRESGRVEGAVPSWGVSKKAGRPPKSDIPPNDDIDIED